MIYPEHPSVFISIPVTGHDMRMVSEHASRVKAFLAKKFVKIYNPLETSTLPGKTERERAEEGMNIIDLCDAVFMCKGWERSRGCLTQHKYAKILGREIIYEQPEDESEMMFFDILF